MTAHIVYRAFDAERPATQSKIVIGDVIRGRIGFDGFLMTDDLSMNALGGDFAQRTERALAAGCDAILHCNGRMAEMTEVARAAQPLSAIGDERLSEIVEGYVDAWQRGIVGPDQRPHHTAQGEAAVTIRRASGRLKAEADLDIFQRRCFGDCERKSVLGSFYARLLDRVGNKCVGTGKVGLAPHIDDDWRSIGTQPRIQFIG